MKKKKKEKQDYGPKSKIISDKHFLFNGFPQITPMLLPYGNVTVYTTSWPSKSKRNQKITFVKESFYSEKHHCDLRRPFLRTVTVVYDSFRTKWRVVTRKDKDESWRDNQK